MTDLYGELWLSRAGEIISEEGCHSQNFLLWCRKLSDLTEPQFKRGMDHVEYRIRLAAASDSKTYPPSYAEFDGFCKPAGQTAAYKPVPSVLDPKNNLLESDAAKAERKRKGREGIAKMREELGL